MNKSVEINKCSYCGEIEPKWSRHICAKASYNDDLNCSVCGRYLAPENTHCECGDLYFIQVLHGGDRNFIGMHGNSPANVLKKAIRSGAFEGYFLHIETVSFYVSNHKYGYHVDVTFNGTDTTKYTYRSRNDCGHPYFEKTRMGYAEEFTQNVVRSMKAKGEELTEKLEKNISLFIQGIDF